MASTLKINTLTGVSTAGSIAVTGEGNSTTTNLQQGLCKAWCRVNMSTPAYHDSFNLGTITDNGTGNYTVNYATAITNANDCAVGWGMRSTDSDSNYICWRRSTPSVTTINVRSTHVWSSGGTNEDLQFYYVVVFCN